MGAVSMGTLCTIIIIFCNTKTFLKIKFILKAILKTIIKIINIYGATSFTI